MISSTRIDPRAPFGKGALLMFVGGAAALLAAVTISAGAGARSQPAFEPDRCAISTDAAGLAPRDRALVARRMLACNDLVNGRITAADYRATLATLESQWARPAPVVAATPAPLRWATEVRDVSTMYTQTSWSASRVLGPPDVHVYGDNVNAWASMTADDGPEWIEVGYGAPVHVSGVQVIETYNPGAVVSIELVMASGERRTVHEAKPTAKPPTIHTSAATFECTDEPVVAVRVKLSSQHVPDWNELDAIGVVTCDDQ